MVSAFSVFFRAFFLCCKTLARKKNARKKTLNADTIRHSQRRGCTFPVPDHVAKNFYRTIFDNYPLKAARFLLLFAPPFSVGHFSPRDLGRQTICAGRRRSWAADSYPLFLWITLCIKIFIELFLITIRLKPLDFCCFLHHPLASGTGKVQPRRWDRKMLQNSCQEKERSEKNAKCRYHQAQPAPGLHFFLITIRLKPLDFCCFLHHPLASGTGKVQPRRWLCHQK
jgi:hypothetical protein